MTVARRRPMGERARPSTSMAVSSETRASSRRRSRCSRSSRPRRPIPDGARPGGSRSRSPGRRPRPARRLGARAPVVPARGHLRGRRALVRGREHAFSCRPATSSIVASAPSRLYRSSRNLQREPRRRVNSSVTALLGNHELLTLQGDYRYVAREELLRLGKASLESKTSVDKRWAPGTVCARTGPPGRWRGEARFRREPGAQIRSNRPLLTVEGEGSCATLFSHAGVRRAHLARHGDSIEVLNAFAGDAIAAIADRERDEKWAPTSEALRPRPRVAGRLRRRVAGRGPGSGALTGAKRRAWRWRRAPSWTRSCDWSARDAWSSGTPCSRAV